MCIDPGLISGVHFLWFSFFSICFHFVSCLNRFGFCVFDIGRAKENLYRGSLEYKVLYLEFRICINRSRFRIAIYLCIIYIYICILISGVISATASRNGLK